VDLLEVSIRILGTGGGIFDILRAYGHRVQGRERSLIDKREVALQSIDAAKMFIALS